MVANAWLKYCTVCLQPSFVWRMLLHTAVNSKTSYVAPGMPQLGLETTSSTWKWPFRVYCLFCWGNHYYVGIATLRDIKDRLAKHFNGTACHFTTMFPAQEILLLQAAPSRAAEAYLYFAMVALKEKITANGRITPVVGGWTQTSSKPSPLSCLLIKESKWMLDSYCFVCGSHRHWSADHKSCKEAEATCWYECKNDACGKKMFLNTRGWTKTSSRQTTKGDEEPPPPAPLPPPATTATTSTTATTAEQKRKRENEQELAAITSKRQRVRVGGEHFSTIAWFLCKKNPNSDVLEKYRAACASHAIELRGGDVKTLQAHDFARSGSGRYKDLLDPAQAAEFAARCAATSLEWTDTSCKNVRSEHLKGAARAKCLQVRKAVLRRGVRQCLLYREQDLQKVSVAQ